ncbi:MAG TPA: dihydroorotate dehydrogenase-like protein [bacterium]|nr:dihydroorotate dehydrogenase-like protein [Candidatus Omnitrophota bacterium]HOL93394.1 dihydroorotate dehydrogenase-like protein [bacterium]HPO98950.1 dihydroorotate dehydrogenase-like protein [bacterium]HXK94038.1 dihydroorotate dehydrogenase-like protein [bacterium]
MDLKTQYLGLSLKNPIVPSASPLSREIDTIKKLEDAGAAAVVMYSLFEEQLVFEQKEMHHFLIQGTESYAEAVSYFPEPGDFRLGPDEYLEHIRKAKDAVDIPVIGSLNGVSTGGWIDYAQKMQQAGADALELNVYYIPTDSNLTAQDVEGIYVDVLAAVKKSVTIPVSVKLSPYFTSLPNMARRLQEAGADGLVLFNRFYQPDLDIESLEVVPNLLLSTPQEMRLPLRWIAILYGRVQLDLAATTGIHSAEDVAKMLMAGATVTMMCSALLRHGVGRITEVLNDLRAWMQEHDYESVQIMRGSLSQKSCPEPAAFERANYMKVLNSYV